MSSSLTDAVEVTMPQMGVSVAEGTIVEWKKRVGDWVEADEPIVEISTDKVETEIPSPASRARGVDRRGDRQHGRRRDGARQHRHGARAGEAHADEGAGARSRSGSGERQRGTAPRARSAGLSRRPSRWPKSTSVDLSQVEGTGRRGRVTKKDVLAFIESQHQAEPALHSESPYREEEPAAKEPEPPLSARSARCSLDDAPAHRQQMCDRSRRPRTAPRSSKPTCSAIEAARGRLSYLPFVARATIAALREYPSLNATWDGERLVTHEEVHLGIAVSLGEDGLIVPVVHNAHELSHEGLAARIKDLAERARDRKR